VIDPPFSLAQIDYFDSFTPLDAFQAMSDKFSGIIKGETPGF